jgi:hypothetical protein
MIFLNVFVAIFWESLGPLIKQAVAWLFKRRRPLLSDLRDELPAELTDPLRFVLGAILILILGGDDFWAMVRIASAFWVAVPVIAVPVLGAVLTGIAPLAYALTVFGAGLFTLIPERLYELRKERLIPGWDYPARLKGSVLVLDGVAVIAGVCVIIVWQFGGPGQHTFWRGATWGLVTVGLADLLTFVACIEIGVAKAVYSQVLAARHAGESVTSVQDVRTMLPQAHAVQELCQTSLANAAAAEAVAQAPVVDVGAPADTAAAGAAPAAEPKRPPAQTATEASGEDHLD